MYPMALTTGVPLAPATRAEWIEQQLADSILDGTYAPGQRLLAARFTQEFGVSLTPLREAFQRLAGRGLVEIDPQRGARVSTVSPQDAKELYDLRLLIEPVALRDSVANLSDAAKAQLRPAFEEYKRLRQSEVADPGGIAQAHRIFHDLLMSGTPSLRMRTLVATLGDHARRYAAATVEDPVAHRDPVAEHEALLTAALAGDADGCRDLLTQHLEVGLRWAKRRLCDSS